MPKNNLVFLLTGSNQGQREEQLRQAARHIGQRVGPIVQRSALYETAAWGITQQPAFYNQVLQVETALPVETLLIATQGIEKAMGRTRSIKWGPRSIDIDILFYNQEILNLPHLQIPHPGIPQRRFTLVPLAEIAPQWAHPLLGHTMEQLLAQCPDALEVKKITAQ